MQQLYRLAEIFVWGGIASALIIAADLRSCRQPMRIMNSVWILTGLWASFVGLWAYFTFGRPRQCDLAENPAGRKSGRKNDGDMRMQGMDKAPADTASGKHRAGRTDTHTPHRSHDMKMQTGSARTSGNMPDMDMPTGDTHIADGMQDIKMPADGAHIMDGMADMEMPSRPRWESVVLSTLHCGAGCTLADLVGEWFLYFVPVAIGGSMLAGTWVVDYILALGFGIGFQYAAIRGMERSLPRGEAVLRAAKADVLSLTAWQAGMYGWMAVAIFVLDGGAPLPRTSFAFWFMMQIAMACGFLVALPVNIVLIRKGIKRGM